MSLEICCRLLWLFLIYSFFGWISETTVAIVRNKKFINRGALNGPWCSVYGVAAVLTTIGFKELRDTWLFLFLGCAALYTLIEWFTAKLLERINSHKWWDYSDKKWNLDGYICLSYSVLWGVLGVLAMKYMNPLLIRFYRWLPSSLMRIVLLVLLVIYLADLLGSVLIAVGIPHWNKQIDQINSGLDTVSLRLRNWLTQRMQHRMEKAYPQMPKKPVVRTKPTVFAEGCTFYKLVLLFFIGAFVGDIVETIFCRITEGHWMSRSSVIWGPFSIVWGLGMMVATALLYNYRDRSDGFLFGVGTLFGGVYEYLCSVFTEIVFGKVFWDYTGIPFNLGGRINLLFCFFWGIAAVLWLKVAYPFLARLIEKLPMRFGKIFTWGLIVFMIVNMAASSLALNRYDTRGQGKEAEFAWETWMDEYYGDRVMKKIYPKAKTSDMVGTTIPVE